MEDRRVLVSLGRDTGVCVPPHCPNSPDPGQDPSGPGMRGLDSPLVAQEALVSRDEGPPGGPSLAPAASPRSDQTALIRDDAPQPEAAAPDCVAIIGSEGRKAGLSARAAEFVAHSHRASTRESYNSRLGAFFQWCEEQAVNPPSAPLHKVVDFFIHLFDKGLALPTIRAYRSAIAVVHRGFPDGTIISNAPTLTKLFKAFFLKRPPSRKLLPSWSLPKVLDALAKSPFEPMASASLFNVTCKTAFLLAIASGQRRSILHALSTAPGHIRWERDGVRLTPRPDFVAKNQTESSRPVEIVIRPLTAFSSVDDDKLWCPVRALKWYLGRTKGHRRHEQLFLTCKEPYSPASRDSVSRWLVSAIKAAGSDVLPTNPHAHDTRGISASWALFAGVPQEDILKAAYWSSPNSFIAYYLRDIPAAEPDFSRAALSAAARIAAPTS